MSERASFLAALDKDLSERAAFLDEACAGNETPRLHATPHPFLDVPALEQLGPGTNFQPAAMLESLMAGQTRPLPATSRRQVLPW
jgi:hypothetical protein